MKGKTFTVNAHCEMNLTFKVKADVEADARKEAEKLADRIYVKLTPVGFTMEEEPPLVIVDDVEEEEE